MRSICGSVRLLLSGKKPCSRLGLSKRSCWLHQRCRTTSLRVYDTYMVALGLARQDRSAQRANFMACYLHVSSTRADCRAFTSLHFTSSRCTLPAATTARRISSYCATDDGLVQRDHSWSLGRARNIISKYFDFTISSERSLGIGDRSGLPFSNTSERSDARARGGAAARQHQWRPRWRRAGALRLPRPSRSWVRSPSPVSRQRARHTLCARTRCAQRV